MLTVTTPPTSTALTTVSHFIDEMYTFPSEPSDGPDISLIMQDAGYIQTLIDAASGIISRWCRREFGQATYTEVLRFPPHGGYTGRGLSKLMLSRCPVVSVTSVTEGTDSALTPSTDFETDLDNGFLYRLDGADSRRDWTASKVTAVYVAGWKLPGDTSPTLPAEIERACVLLVRDNYLTRGRDITLRGVTLDGASTTIGTGNPGLSLPQHIEALLLPWRLAVL